MLPYELIVLDPVLTGHTNKTPPLLIAPQNKDSYFHQGPSTVGLGFIDSSGDSYDISSGGIDGGWSDLPSPNQWDIILNDVSGGGQTYSQDVNGFLASIGIGLGRQEADVIVLVQNRLMYNLGLITQQILVTSSPSLSTLYSLFSQVRTLGNNFVQFVLSSQFTDRRASGQALNTVMPYIDGTCGYAVPLGYTATPSRFNCITWGMGTIGGDGSDGMLGAIRRAITVMGGTPPGDVIITNPPTGGTGGVSTMGLSTPLLVGIGVLAIFLFSRKGGL